MQSYFFDYVSSDDTIHDYNGRVFPTVGRAREHAELLAIHLQHDPEAKYDRWFIVARDARGAEIFSVMVPAPADDHRVVFKTLPHALVMSLPL
jgi:hypothetical protein